MVTQRTFGTLPSGEEVQIYHLENKSGAFAEVLQFGAILVKLCVPDRDGRLTDVVLGYDDLAGYEVNGCFFGATIGRSGNRIAQSRFTLDGKEIVLTPNEGANNLHSGPDGFEKNVDSFRDFRRQECSYFFKDQPGWREWFSGRI